MILILALTLAMFIGLMAGYRFLMKTFFIAGFFGLGPLLLLVNAGRLDLQPFTWAKVFTLAASIGVIFILPGVEGKARRVLARVVTAIVVLNILEAVVADAFKGLWINAIVGASLIATMAGSSKVGVKKTGTRLGLTYDLPWPWLLAYTLWNFTVVCGLYPEHYFDHCAVLAAPIAAVLIARDHRVWLEARAFTLSVYAISIVLTIDVFNLPWIPSAPAPGAAYPYFSAAAAGLALWNLVTRFRPATRTGADANATA